MGKVNPNKRIQKRRTEQEMRNALADAIYGKEIKQSMPPQDDDTDIVLLDCIEELLEARQTVEEMRGFVVQWNAKFSRK